MTSETIIPQSILNSWEAEAVRQKLSRDEFMDFLRDKEKSYYESLEVKVEKPKVFTNSACNRLTDYGQTVALKTLLAIPRNERAVKFARWEFEELKDLYPKVLEGKADTESFSWRVNYWYKKLRDDMKEQKLSRKFMETLNFDFREATKFFHTAQTLSA